MIELFCAAPFSTQLVNEGIYLVKLTAELHLLTMHVLDRFHMFIKVIYFATAYLTVVG